MNVLSLCGPESGLPKNPSVCFSSHNQNVIRLHNFSNG